MASALVITPQHGFVLGTLATSFLVQVRSRLRSQAA